MDYKNIYPKVLIVANNAFSTTEANGRTLGNFFVNWPKERLAQFALRAENPDTTRCTNYFIVSDGSALHSFKTGHPAKNSYQKSNSMKAFLCSNSSKIKRSALTMLLRNLIWKSNRWHGHEFDKWVDAFAPDIILLQAGDAPFMYDLALSLAQKRHIPLVMYNSECYYFKTFCYFTNTRSTWLYPLFRAILKHSFKQFMKKVSGAIYITDALENLHQTAFKHNSITLMTSSSLPKKVHIKPLAKNPQIVYLGNLGLNRHKNLIKIAQEIQKINPAWKIQVYGKIPQQIQREMSECPCIELKGFVSYEDVTKIEQTADLLLHTEYNDAFYLKDLQYAFSTKIADCLSSGVPFLVYAPGSFSFIDYLSSNKAAFVATTPNDLTSILKQALLDPDKRAKQVDSALKLAIQNHDLNRNATRFEHFLQEIYENIAN